MSAPSAYTLLYNGPVQLLPRSLEEIAQAVTVFADTVYLRVDSHPHPALDRETARFITKKIDELREIDAVRVYAFEDVPMSRFPHHRPLPSPDVVVSKSQYDELQNSIGQKLLRDKNSVLAQAKSIGELAGLTELVEARRTLWTIGVARLVGATRIMSGADSPPAAGYDLSRYFRFAQLEGPALQRFLQLVNIGPLSVLAQDDVNALRRLMPHFRGAFLARSDAATVELADQPKLVSEIAAEIASEYQDKLEERVSRNSYWSMALGAARTCLVALSVFYPAMRPISASATAAHWLLDWGGSRSTSLPMLFLLELRKRQRAKAR